MLISEVGSKFRPQSSHFCIQNISAVNKRKSETQKLLDSESPDGVVRLELAVLAHQLVVPAMRDQMDSFQSSSFKNGISQHY